MDGAEPITDRHDHDRWLAELGATLDRATPWEVPALLDVLPDGREAIVIGDVQQLADLGHRQGANTLGFEGTCGICSCEGVLRQFGIEVTESELVEHAALNGECAIVLDLEKCGGTSGFDQAEILRDHGVPAHMEQVDSLEDVAEHLEQGRAVIAQVNCGVLWNDGNYFDDGGANHAIVVTGVARSPETGEVIGVFVNDSGTGQAGRLVDATEMRAAWLDAGGFAVVTDISTAAGAEKEVIGRV